MAKRNLGKLKLYRRHLAACAHKSKGQKFDRCHCPIWIRGTWAGEAIRKSLDVDTWERAEAIKQEIESGKKEQDIITLDHALTSFIAECESRNLNSSTLSKYRLLAGHLRAFGQDRGFDRCADITADSLRDFRATRHLSPRTSSKELERIKAFFKFCVENDWLQKSPAKSIRTPELRPNPTLPFTDEEVSKIVAHSQGDRKAAAFFRTLLHSGLRIIDVAALRPERIQDGKLFLYQQKTGMPVWIPLPPDLVEDLNRLPLVGGFYFMVGSENPQTIAKYYRAKLKKCGVKDARPHRFRDTFSVNLLLKGVPLETVSILLGHTDIKTTQQHYSPWVKGRQENLEREIMKTWEQPKLVRVK